MSRINHKAIPSCSKQKPSWCFYINDHSLHFHPWLAPFGSCSVNQIQTLPMCGAIIGNLVNKTEKVVWFSSVAWALLYYVPTNKPIKRFQQKTQGSSWCHRCKLKLNLPKAAVPPGGWGPTIVCCPPGVGGTGRDQDLSTAGPTVTTPTYSTNVPGKFPFSLVLSLIPCNQPLGLRSSPSWYSSPTAAISVAFRTVSRSPGWRLISSPCSCSYSKSARYWKLWDAIATRVHRKVQS